MKNFFLDIFKKLISTVFFAALMFVASYCLITGEFPPKLANMKKGISSLQTQIQQLNQIRDSQMAKIVAATNQTDEGSENAHTLEAAELKYQQALMDKIKELEARIVRLENQNK